MSDSETPQWYLGLDGEATGPLPMADIKKLFATGKANGKTQAWMAGMDDWVDASTLEAFKPFLAAPPPMKKPAPPVLPAAKAAPAPVVAPAEPAKPLSPEEIMTKELGLTPKRIEAMAVLAVELAGQTRVRLGLTSPPPRLGLVERTR
jgi:GYF domain 2